MFIFAFFFDFFFFFCQCINFLCPRVYLGLTMTRFQSFWWVWEVLRHRFTICQDRLTVTGKCGNMLNERTTHAYVVMGRFGQPLYGEIHNVIIDHFFRAYQYRRTVQLNACQKETVFGNDLGIGSKVYMNVHQNTAKLLNGKT